MRALGHPGEIRMKQTRPWDGAAHEPCNGSLPSVRWTRTICSIKVISRWVRQAPGVTKSQMRR